MTESEINKLIDNEVSIDDGELQVQGIIRSIFKGQVLIEVDVDQAPLEFSVDAVKAAILGFDLEEFPQDKRYIAYDINDSLEIFVPQSK